MNILIDEHIPNHTKIFNYRLKKIIIHTVRTSFELEKIYNDPQVSILILNNKEMQELNKKFRGVDGTTDVLSFPMIDFSNDSGRDNNNLIKKNILLGDIVININKVFLQAREYMHSPEREIGFLVTHGILHLLGYDHMDPASEKIMFSKQNLILEKAGLMV